MASSSVVHPKEKYDVFLSFRGLDTRKTFTSHLHAALMMRKVVTYIDYKIEKGDEVGPALYKAIEESKFFVIIFSKDYASSTWCLDELAYILKCEKKNGQQGRVVPIFYEVEPSHVRHLIGTYKTAFAKHKQRSKDKVAEWKEALRLAASISGFDSTSKTVRDDADLVEQVVRYLLAKLNRESSSDLTDLIGGEGRIQKILLEYIIPEDICVRCVVLWGMGGIGKTTLADAVFHGLSSQFEAQCFLPNVRTRSGARGNCSPELYNLRNELLQKLLGDEKLTITTPTINAPVKERLRRMKVLVVLDDVNHSNQLTFLAREVPFGPGSRIIITTRDLQPVKETLQVKNVADFDVKIYEVEKLNGVESLQLFHSNAPAHFKENLEFLTKVVDYAGGIPLALNVLRGLCHICNSKEELEQLWDRLKRDPEDRFQEVYRTSFDGLRKSEREIFLDIACFHKREKLCDTKRILAACGLLSDIGIKTLIDMSLISIKDDRIWMHDVIQEMGWEIVREESPDEPGKRSRLHNYKDVRTVLEGNKGTASVHCISCIHYSGAKLAEQAFLGMDNLRFLMLSGIDHPDGIEDLGSLPNALCYLHWFQYPLQSLPSEFSPDNLVELHMPCSKLKRLWGENQNLNNLKRIDLSNSLDLAEVGELSNSVNIESINLVGCESLVQVPPYFEKFTKLTHLDLRRCSKLRSLPNLPGNIEALDLIGTAIEELTPSVCSLEKLRKLDLKSCSSIKIFSSSPWRMRSLNHLCLRETKIETVPSSSFSYMTEITSLDLRDCDRFVSLPADICELKSLKTLDLSGCSSFTTFPEIVEPLEHLQDLNLSKTNLQELPSSFENLVGIKKLDLSDCTNLESLPNSFNNFEFLEWFSLCGCVKLNESPFPFTLSSLKHLDLEGCELLKEIPDCFTNFPALKSLYLSGTMIETIPPSIEKVSRLKSLSVRNCIRLQSLPVLPCLLEKLDAEGCTRLETVLVSVIAHTQGLDEMLSEMESSISNDFRTESHSFLGCVNLDKISKSHIMDDAYFRIMRLATIHKQKLPACDNVAVICTANKIPDWFSYQRRKGSSLNIQLPLHWPDDSNFLGIALCSVFAIFAHREMIRCECEMILTNNNGETYTVNLGTEHFVSSAVTFETDHMLVWYVPRIFDEAKWSTEASFRFYTKVGGVELYNVQSCGVCFLNAQTRVVTTKEADLSEFHSTTNIVWHDAELGCWSRKRPQELYTVKYNMASSSKEKCEVFLSFRGVDTRETFTSHLHAALIRRKVETYIDYRLERGDEVGPALYKAIEESKISMIIFSENYASSTWCLNELAYILKCKEKYGQLVIPIFYKVEPTQVRHQTQTYGIAFAEHVQRLKDDPDKVEKWKDALVEAASLFGFDSKVAGDDSNLVEEVISDVLAKLKREPSIDLTRLIGAEDRIQKILLELDIIPEDVRVRCVVLWGMGGIGKTTLAEAVYYGLSSQFQAHCFLANVRERSGTKQALSPELCALRKELLAQLLDNRIFNIPSGTIPDYIKSRLRRTKALVVLDDVDDSSQLTYLAGEIPFGPGSRIIVTTRDMQPVKDTSLVKNVADYDVKIYKMEELNDVESLQLLHSIAPAHFTKNSQCSKKVVDHAAGIPLALEILHPLLRRCEIEEQLAQLWARLTKFPDEKLLNVYTASYDGLERNQKDIFLDLACFHKGEKRGDVERILAACGLFPDGIDILIDMSLISIKDDCIWMHDVIQEMAWETVREESQKPGERSRLHDAEDVYRVLKGNEGTTNVESISYRIDYENLKLDPQAFAGMSDLRYLKLNTYPDKMENRKFAGMSDLYLDNMPNLVCLPDALRYLDWNGYPFQSLPSKFSPDNLVVLHMRFSKLKSLWGNSQNLKKLKRIDLSGSRDLAAVGGLSNSVNIESINLENCKSLVEIPSYFKQFTKLTYLNLGFCSRISILREIPCKMEFLDLSGTTIEELPPSVLTLEKLRQLNLERCKYIKNFSSSPWKMRSLNNLCLRWTNIERVPSSSFLFMTGIISLDLRGCARLVSLPTDICKLKSLESLDLYGCFCFTNFPEIAEPMEHLHDLKLKGTKIEELPSSVGNLVGLEKLDLSECTNLESLPNSFNNFEFLEWFSLSGCVKLKELPLRFTLSSLKHLDLERCKLLKEIPDCFTNFPALEFLDLSGTMIETIPRSIENVYGLKSLRVRKCIRLQSLPVLPCQELDAEGCTRLEAVSVSPIHTQGLDEMLSDMEFSMRTQSHSFFGCVNLDEISKSRIMDDAHFRIMRMATSILLRSHVVVICPGNEIPKWFSHGTQHGSSLNIKLPLHWADDLNFLGIALCSVLPISAVSTCRGCVCECDMILKTNNVETHTVYLGYPNIRVSAKTVEEDNVLVWYDTTSLTFPSEEAKWSTEASFHFYIKVPGEKLNNVVKSCGVCFLYAQPQNDDALKFEVIPPQL